MPSNSSPRITLKDVAREAGVGESTVSRVLRGQGAVSAKSLTRIQAAVDRLGYVRNHIAGALASNRSKLIGIVIPSVTNSVFGDILAGIAPVLAGFDRQPVVAVTDYDLAREEQLIESLLAWRPKGLIVTGLEHSDRATEIMRNSGIRIAEILDTDGPGIDIVVGFSQCEVGQASARLLLARGYRRIGYVGHDLTRDLRAAKRYEAFCEELAKGGSSLADKEVNCAPTSIDAGSRSTASLLERSPELDAIYFSNDDMAVGGYYHCLAHQVLVPERVALLGCNGLEAALLAPQPISSIATPRREIGELAAKLICSDVPSGQWKIGFTLRAGATT